MKNYEYRTSQIDAANKIFEDHQDLFGVYVWLLERPRSHKFRCRCCNQPIKIYVTDYGKKEAGVIAWSIRVWYNICCRNLYLWMEPWDHADYIKRNLVDLNSLCNDAIKDLS